MYDKQKQIESLFNLPSTPLQKVDDALLAERGINLFIKREDLNDPELSGNKLHKLKYNLFDAREKGYKKLLTFGGAYSNHIYALAAAGKRFGFETIGVIRGEEHLPLNPTLSFAKSCGMKITYMGRSVYRNKTSMEVQDKLFTDHNDFYLIPEGGTNELAVKGCSEIINSIEIDYDLICTACGTGGTLAGLVAGLSGNKSVLGFAILKGAAFLTDDVRKLLTDSGFSHLYNWTINPDYHFGGYAKITADLIRFINNFEMNSGITLDPIYTGKMLFGIYDLIYRKLIKEGTTIVALHTGGLQGLDGLKQKLLSLSGSL